MLKKMLKSVLAIATVCAMAVPAYADTSVKGSVGTSFGMESIGGTTTYSAPYFFQYGWTYTNNDGAKAYVEVEANNYANTFKAKEAYVSVPLTDSVKMEIGTMASVKIPMLGHGTTFGSDESIPYCVYAGPGIPSFYATSQGVQFAIGLGGAGNVFAGLLEGTDIGFYGLYTGAAGDLDYVVGMLSANDTTNTGFTVNYNMGAMRAALDYMMDDTDGSDPMIRLNFAMKEAGPGSVDFIYVTHGDISDMAFRYGLMMGGVGLDIIYNSQAGGASDNSWMGVSLGTRF